MKSDIADALLWSSRCFLGAVLRTEIDFVQFYFG